MNFDIKYILILCTVLFIACGAKNQGNAESAADTSSDNKMEQPTSTQAESTTTTTAPASTTSSQRDTITVSNLEDLVANAKDNTIVYLESGTYTIEEHIVYYVNEDDNRVIDKRVEDTKSMGGQLFLKGLTNFQLIGKKGTKITSKNPEAIPLFVVKGDRLKFSNLTISKAVDGNADLAYVSGCKNVDFVLCNFDGGGTFGLNILNTNQLKFNNCKIQNCSKGILKAYGSQGLSFKNSEFSENNCSVAPINIYGDGSSVTFSNVVIQNNKRNTSTNFQDSDKLITAGSNSLFINNSVIDNNPGFKFLGISANLLTNSTVSGLQ